MDVYALWAQVICSLPITEYPSRRYAAGLISPSSQDGHIQGCVGLEGIMERYGEWIFRVHIPPTGSRTNPVGAGYLGHAYIFVKHPDYDECRRILDDIGRSVKLIAS